MTRKNYFQVVNFTLMSVLILLTSAQRVSGASFTDTFSTDSSASYKTSGVFPWNNGGKFIYDVSGKRMKVVTGDQVGLGFSHTLPPLENGSFTIDFQPTQKYPRGGQVFIYLLQDANNYYLLFDKDGYRPGGLQKVVNGNVVKSVAFEKEYHQNIGYHIFIAFKPDLAIAEAFDQVLTLNTSSQSITVNQFVVQIIQQDAYFDNIIFSDEPYIRIIQPQTRHFQVRRTLSVKSIADHLKQGWGVRFILDLYHKNEMIVDDYTFPYETVFTGLKKREHTVHAFIIDASGDELPGPMQHDLKIQIGIGDYYVAVGDSITVGVGDDNASDNVSLDGRNLGGGYEPILNNALTQSKGYPQTVINEGFSGEDSMEGLVRLPRIINRNPQAKYFLIMYGTNDSSIFRESGLGFEPGDSGYAGSFKDNIQQMITMILGKRKVPYLAKAPIAYGSSSHGDPFGDPFSAAKNIRIQEYNQVIDNLIVKNGIRLVPPDFYSHFENNPQEYSDNLHMNGTGYRSLAAIWLDALTH